MGDTLFEDLWQDLRPYAVRWHGNAKPLQGLGRRQNPHQTLRLVLLPCGLDQSRYEIASHFTLPTTTTFGLG
jgi:hypothetical protein